MIGLIKQCMYLIYVFITAVGLLLDQLANLHSISTSVLRSTP